MKKTLQVSMLLLGLSIMFFACNSGVKSERNQDESVTENKKSDKPSESVVRFRLEGVEIHRGEFKCKALSCKMNNNTIGGTCIYDGANFCTCDIVVPEGQRWAFKDYNADYKGDRYITKPFIFLMIGDTRKKYQLPKDGRDVVFYPGDVIRIGTYLSGYHYDYVDVTVVFFVNYN